MDIQAQLTGFAMIGATWIMWLLVALSIVSLAVMIERAIFFVRAHDDIAALRGRLLELLAGHELEAARHLLAGSRSFEARVAIAGLDVADRGAPAAAEKISGATVMARLAMDYRLAFLGTVGANAPFIGLLGTVIGIIRAFSEFNASGGKVSAGLMAEVGEALVATAIGILVAIPALVAYNYFQRVIRTRMSRAESLAHDVLAHLQGAGA